MVVLYIVLLSVDVNDGDGICTKHYEETNEGLSCVLVVWRSLGALKRKPIKQIKICFLQLNVLMQSVNRLQYLQNSPSQFFIRSGLCVCVSLIKNYTSMTPQWSNMVESGDVLFPSIAVMNVF